MQHLFVSLVETVLESLPFTHHLIQVLGKDYFSKASLHLFHHLHHLLQWSHILLRSSHHPHHPIHLT